MGGMCLKTALFDRVSMVSGSALSIVIPTHNESENLPVLLEEIDQELGTLCDYEVVVVDDDSSDGTLEVLSQLNGTYGNIRVVARPKKMGISSALLDGFKASNGRFLAVMDADLQHSPEVLPRMFKEVVSGADLVIASRYKDGGRIEGWSPWRMMVSRVATFLARSMPKAKCAKDPLSGFFVFKREAVNLRQLDGIGCKLLLEILVRGTHRGVVEVPYVFKSRARGSGKLGFREYMNFLRLLFKLLWTGI
jgi:dolichol-phosphate mannosyltransferase